MNRGVLFLECQLIRESIIGESSIIHAQLEESETIKKWFAASINS